jgi:hypothetical protein
MGRWRAARAARLAAWVAAGLLVAASGASGAERYVGFGSTIGPIVKEHNVPGANGLGYLRLRIPANLKGERGNLVALGVWFADESGSLIPSALPHYADAAGFLKVESPQVRVRFDPAQREYVLDVPYAAFPRRVDKAPKYYVEARAKLIRRSQRHGIITQATTSFWVAQ